LTDDFDELLPQPFSMGETMTGEQLGALLGISGRVVRELAQRGIIAKASRGAYPVADSIARYCAHLREQAAGRSGNSNLTAERIRVAQATAEKIELQNAVARGEMVAVSDVRREWVTVATDLRAALLAIPARVSARVSLSREASALLDDELRLSLEEIS